MSSGKVHATASVVLSVGFATCSVVTGRPEFVRCAVGAVVGVFVSPDLDLNGGLVQGTFIQKKTGWLGKKLWEWFWRPYSLSVKHGSFVSHFPIFSTLVRLLYLYFWIILLPSLVLEIFAGRYFDLPYELKWWLQRIDAYAVLGLAGSDTIHFLLDILTKEKRDG